MKILAFTYYANIWPHAFTEALCLDALALKGHEVTTVGCKGLLNRYCNCMAALSVDVNATISQKEKVCKSCRMRRKILKDSMGLPHVLLEDVLTPEDISECEALVDSTPYEALVNIEWRGLPIGRSGSYEYFLRYKRLTVSSDPEQISFLKTCIINVMYSAMTASKLLEQLQPDAIWSHNNAYGVNFIIHILALRSGIQSLSHGLSSNFAERMTRCYVLRGTFGDLLDEINADWPNRAHMPIAPHVSDSVAQHYKTLFDAKLPFVYSSRVHDSGTPREHFGVPETSKLLLAILSSYDEASAAEFSGISPKYPSVYPMQTDWLTQLIKWIKDRPDYFLVIRVHPREYRSAIESEHSTLLAECLRDLPDNVVVNMPSDGLSIYQFLNETDLVLNAWSTSGREFTLFGIPVVTYTLLCACAEPLTYYARTEEEYFELIPRALETGWSSDLIVRSFRWHAMELQYSTVDISESSRLSDLTPDQIMKRIATGVARRVLPGSLEKFDCFRRARAPRFADVLDEMVTSPEKSIRSIQMDQAPVVSESEELAGIKEAMRMLYRALFRNGGAKKPDSLQQHLANWLELRD